MHMKKTRFVALVLVALLITSISATALAELSGSGSSGTVSGYGTFTVTATGSMSFGRAILRVTSSNSSSSNMISIRVFKGSTELYSGGILTGNSYIDCSLPAFLTAGTYTVEYNAASSTNLYAEFNP